MTSVKIYGIPLSAPTRIVMMTCEVLGISYELIHTNPLTGDTRTEEYLKVTFCHVYPSLYCKLVMAFYIASECNTAVYFVKWYTGQFKWAD
jgi:hypothetical protein